MGQKVNPIGLRLGIIRTWDSRWFESKQYPEWLHEDIRIRKVLSELSRSAAVSRVEIERRANQVRVMVNTGKPGILIGRRGAGIEELRKKLEKVTSKQIQLNVVEIKHPELDAKLVANNIIDQLEKRIAFRRAMRQAIQRTMRAGAKGVKVQCAGRLGGAEIARVERNFDGKVPLHTLRANVDYANVEAYTTYGRIGVKVWVYLGEIIADGKAKAEPQPAKPLRERRARRAAKPAAEPETGAASTPATVSPALETPAAGSPAEPAQALSSAEPASSPAEPAQAATPTEAEPGGASATANKNAEGESA